MKIATQTSAESLFLRAMSGHLNRTEIQRIGIVARCVTRLEMRAGTPGALHLLTEASKLSDFDFGRGLIECFRSRRVIYGRRNLRDLIQEWGFVPSWAAELSDRDFSQLIEALYVAGDLSALRVIGGAA